MRRYGGSLFGLTSMHQIIVNHRDMDRFLSQSYHTLNSEPIQYTMLTRICGATDSPELKTKFEKSWRELGAPIERQFVNEALASAAIKKGRFLEQAMSLVTFATDVNDLKRWERAAAHRVIPFELGGQGVEANFHSLIRDFGACFAVPLLYGQDFLDRHSELLNDFWRFDNDVFPLLMMGIPSWAPFQLMKEGIAGRSRLVSALEGLYRRIDQHQRGEPVDLGADMSDVSLVLFERNLAYNQERWSFKARGENDLVILWGQNANTQPILFWLLTYVYSTKGLLQELREELKPHTEYSKAKPPEIMSMDLPALSRNCPLLKACIYETYRLAHEPASVRCVARPITINDGAYKHEVKSGAFVTAAHCFTQRDPNIYANPDTFVPDRFLNSDPESGKRSAQYGALRPWGSGNAMCKGRTFAEKELVALGAAIISLWDIEPVGGTWDLPAMIPGMGAKKPVKDIRVVIRRRVLQGTRGT